MVACGGSAGAQLLRGPQQTYRMDLTGSPMCSPRGGGAAAFSSWTGRAVSARRAHAVPGATILVVGPGGRPAAGETAAAPQLKVLICAQPGADNMVNAGILTVLAPGQTVAELQDMVDSDPGVLLTVDVYRRDVRARGELVGRFELPPFWPGEGMSASLLLAGRLLGSPGLRPDDRSRLQRRFTAICDAMKAQGADETRIAWRLDRLVAEITRRCQPGQGGPGCRQDADR
jgi:hypothetical protein